MYFLVLAWFNYYFLLLTTLVLTYSKDYFFTIILSEYLFLLYFLLGLDRLLYHAIQLIFPAGENWVVFANGSINWGSTPGRVIPKTQKMNLDTSLLNTSHYKVRIKSKVEQSRERNSALPYTLLQ